MSPQYNIRTILIRVFLALLAILALYTILSYTIVTISVQSPGTEDITVVARSLDTKKSTTHTIKAGDSKKIILKRGSYTISATQAQSKTISSFKARILSFEDVYLNLKGEAAVSRIATSSQGCGGQFGNSYYSYRCAGEIRIFKHQAFDAKNRGAINQLDASSTYRSVINTKTGILGIIDDQEGGILVEELLLPSEESHPVDTSFISEDEDTGGYQLIGNSSKKYTKEFALVNQKTGILRLYGNNTDTKPFTLDMTTDITDISKYHMINQYNQLTGESVISLYDVFTDNGEGTTKKEHSPDNRNLVVIKNTKGTLVDAVTLPTDDPLESVQLLDPTHLIAKTLAGGIIIYEFSDGRATQTAAYDGASTLSVHNGLALVGIDHGIYKISSDGLSIDRVFESEHLTIAYISQTANDIEFTAFVNERDPLYTSPDTYRIDLKAKAIYPRDQQYLPMTNNEIRSMDYNDTQIQVQLNLSTISFDRATGQASYDQEEFNDLSQRATNELKKLSLIRGRKLLFIY